MKRVNVKNTKSRLTDEEWSKVEELNKARNWGYDSEDIYHLAKAAYNASMNACNTCNMKFREGIFSELAKVFDWHPKFTEQYLTVFAEEVREFIGACLEDANYHEEACLIRGGVWNGIINRFENK